MECRVYVSPGSKYIGTIRPLASQSLVAKWANQQGGGGNRAPGNFGPPPHKWTSHIALVGWGQKSNAWSRLNGPLQQVTITNSRRYWIRRTARVESRKSNFTANVGELITPRVAGNPLAFVFP